MSSAASRILLSSPPLSAPQPGQQWWGQDLLLVRHQLPGQVHQPLRADESPHIGIGQILCKKPGQEGSTFTPPALMRALVCPPSPSCRIRAQEMQASSQPEAMQWLSAPSQVRVAGSGAGLPTRWP